MSRGTEAIERALANGVIVKSKRSAGAARTHRLGFTWATKYPPITAPDCIVAGLLEAGTLAVMFGESNSGKSTLALDIALAVARGEPWCGRATQHGVVLWLALESAAGLRRRVLANIKHTGQLAGLFADITDPVALLQAGDAAAIIETAEAARTEAGESVALIVVDTLARAIAGGDENDGGDIGVLIRHCDEIRKATGATVLLIHHSGKDSTRGARGHSSLRAAVDTEIEITGQANPRMARVTKQRDLPSGDTFAFDLEPVEIPTETAQEPMTACVIVHRDLPPPAPPAARGKAQAAILRALRNRQSAVAVAIMWPTAELRRIGRELGQHRNTARDAVDGLAIAGLLTPTVGGYRLTEATP